MSSTSNFEELALRKAALLQRSAELRGTLSTQAQATFGPAFMVVERVRTGGHWLWQHPLVLGGIGVLLLGRRVQKASGGWLTLGRRLWSMWRTWRQFQPRVGGKAKT